MNKSLKTLALLGLIATLTTGCATNRSELQLATPVSQAERTNPAKGINVVIASVKDDRQFEAAPSDPSTPSLGFEGSANATQELKSRAIARKRNGFGKALGDVVLQDGQTVPGIIHDTLTNAFKQAGFNVAGEAGTGTSPMIINVRIKKFWSWMTPGFWALTFESRIEAELDIQGKPTPVLIQAYATDSRQLGTDSAWLEITGKALQEFQVQAIGKAVALP